MGKRYFCDYCNKIMVSTPYSVRVHNRGLVHQKLVSDHYQQFKDPEVILKEESHKRPCTRNLNESCQFGFMCRFSHYTPEQIQEITQIVQKRKETASSLTQPSFQDLYQRLQAEKSSKTDTQDDSQTTVLCDKNGLTHILPWTFNENMNQFNNLPVSLKRIEIDDFANASFNKWG